MSTLEDRGNSFENKYAHDENTRFRINSRRSKLIGLWAAKELGKTGEDASNYAAEIVGVGIDVAGAAGVVQRLVTDLKRSEIEINEKMNHFLAVAEDQITTE